MKRFYTEASIVDTPDGFAIRLDARAIKTPGRWPLLAPTRALAEAIAEEWRCQGATIRPDTMPLTALAGTVLDHVAANRAPTEEALLRFARSDLVCYRAEGPAELVRLQRAHWGVLIDWLGSTHGVRLAVTEGISPVSQDPEALAALGAVLAMLDPWRLGALQAAAAASGSLVVALALIEGRIDAEQAFAAAELDESFNIAHWGEDPEATARREGVARDLKAARRFCELLGD